MSNIYILILGTTISNWDSSLESLIIMLVLGRSTYHISSTDLLASGFTEQYYMRSLLRA